MGRIAIYGGTFNPVHKEHFNIVQNIKKEFRFDKIIVVPTYKTPLKDGYSLADEKDRLKMLKIAFRALPFVEISDFELLKKGLSYTYETLEHLKSENPKDQLFFVMGIDSLVGFDKWKNPEKIVENASIICFDRENSGIDVKGACEDFEKKYNRQIVVASYVGKEVSSTYIRALKMFKLSADEFLDEEVEKYIDEKSLYKWEFCDLINSTCKPSRVEHTARVVAYALARYKKLGLNVDDVVTACGLHDVVKNVKGVSINGVTLDEELPEPIVHSHLGAKFAKEVLKIDNDDVINAIKYHTTGRPNMSALEKLVFVADLLECKRNYDGVEALRKAVDEDFEKGFALCVKELMKHLNLDGKTIYKDTILAYNYYVNETRS